LANTRIQLCGRLVAEVAGRRIDDELPGRQGRLLFVFLVSNRLRAVARDEVVDAIWRDRRDGGLRPLLSKLRRHVDIAGRAELRLKLPPGSWVDLEAAADAVHRAESAVSLGEWTRAWGPAQAALFIATRAFLPGEDAPWIDERRRHLDDIRLRALEAYGEAAYGIGGTELAAAVRAGRALTAAEPYRETGHRLLMRALTAQENVAEALGSYERLRTALREDLGAAPSGETQRLHRSLLDRTS
jgi:DNA-binding SARP family transcriptional activator